MPKFHLWDLSEIIGLLILFAGALLLLLHIDDVLNLDDVTCNTLLCCQTLKGTQHQQS